MARFFSLPEEPEYYCFPGEVITLAHLGEARELVRRRYAIPYDGNPEDLVQHLPTGRVFANLELHDIYEYLYQAHPQEAFESWRLPVPVAEEPPDLVALRRAAAQLWRKREQQRLALKAEAQPADSTMSGDPARDQVRADLEKAALCVPLRFKLTLKRLAQNMSPRIHRNTVARRLLTGGLTLAQLDAHRRQAK
jgi:hypothetical protein